MRAALLCLLLAGCATVTPCAPLPTLGDGVDPVEHMAVMAQMYADCSAGRR